MEPKVLCTKSVYHSDTGQYYSAGEKYSIAPVAELADFFAYEPELRAQLRAEHAAKYKKPALNLVKAAEKDIQRLQELAVQAALTTTDMSQGAKTLYQGTEKPIDIPTDKPVALSEITAEPVQDWV